MNSIKVVSFDFWNTLATPNPKYATQRNSYLMNYGITQAHYTQTKKTLDNLASIYGVATNPKFCIAMLLSMVGDKDYSHIQLIKNELQYIFYQHQPTFDGYVKKSIDLLLKKNISWGVISNTNFISGNILSDIIYSTFGYSPKALVFSDILGESKPSKRIFREFEDKLRPIYNPYNILHIGDDLLCDFYGAGNAGFKSKLISTPEDIYGVVKNLNGGLL
jgi:HAD superfamily hydrolase (TIGR01549 family)